MTVTSPYEELAAAVELIVNNEFASEEFVLLHDNLHESLGWERTTIGVAPVEEVPRSNNRLVQETVALVKWYGKYDKDVDPYQRVDPRPITRLAERFRRACYSAELTGTAGRWYILVDRIEYPDDPISNKTRFVATVRSLGQNSSLVETTG